MLKIVHTADIHAGKPLSLELDKERRYIRRREIETGLWRIVDFAKEEKANILLIAGDLFEHLYTRPSWVKDVSLLFSTIPETHILISPGNHDPLLPDSLYHSTVWPDNVTIFSSSGFGKVSLEDLGVDVYGLGWASFLQRSRLLEGFHVQRQDRFNIVLIHADLADESTYLPLHSEDIVNSGADYFALGHIHVPMSKTIGKSTVVYPGCPEPLDFGDEGQRGVYLVTLKEQELAGPQCITTEFVPMALRMVRTAEVDVAGIDTGEKIRNAILSVDSAENRKKDMWKITLSGRLDPDIGLDLAMLQHEFTDEFFSLRLVPRFIPDYDLEPLMDPNNQSLEARFVRKLTRFKQKAQQKGEAETVNIVNRAMYYGLDALRLGEIVTGRRLD